MCGVAGILKKSNKYSPEQLAVFVEQMTDTIAYRGPDDNGIWIAPDGSCVLGHRRLSIIDTSAKGHQPMVDAENKTALSYNGELYNYQALKRELQKQGVVFNSESDTEVVLQAISRWGEEAFEKMDGMYGLAYYDSEQNRLILARDRFGEKPLYYCETEDYFAFASELHALALLPGFNNRIDSTRIGLYISFQYVPAPHSIYCGASKLLPGHILTREKDTSFIEKPYFTFRTSDNKTSARSLNEKAEELEEILVDALKRRLLSDVPLGAFLSGGVDSSTVVALVSQRLKHPLKTFSIGFEGSEYSEHKMAAKVAKELGVDFEHEMLPPSWTLRAPEIASMLDEPNGDSSCMPTYMLSKLARKDVTVALSGDGGDEIFGGYDRYFAALDDECKMLAGDEVIRSRGMGRQYYYHSVLMFPDHHLQAFMGGIPKKSLDFLENLRGEVNFAYMEQKRPLGNVLREMDAKNYLPGAVLAKVDRMSMQHGLEVRTPFLDKDVARFAAGLAQDDCFAPAYNNTNQNASYQGKVILKIIAEKYLPSSWLNQPKKGFNIPGNEWQASDLIQQLNGLINDGNCQLQQWIPLRNLQQYVQNMKKMPNPYQIWVVIILETWLRTHSWRAA